MAKSKYDFLNPSRTDPLLNAIIGQRIKSDPSHVSMPTYSSGSGTTVGAPAPTATNPIPNKTQTPKEKEKAAIDIKIKACYEKGGKWDPVNLRCILPETKTNVQSTDPEGFKKAQAELKEQVKMQEAGAVGRPARSQEELVAAGLMSPDVLGTAQQPIQTDVTQQMPITGEPVSMMGALPDPIEALIGGTSPAGQALAETEFFKGLTDEQKQVLGTAIPMAGGLAIAGFGATAILPYFTNLFSSIKTTTTMTNGFRLSVGKLFTAKRIIAGVASLGGAGGIVKLNVATAGSILSSSSTELSGIITGVENGLSEAQARENWAQVMQNINTAERNVHKWAMYDVLGLLGLEDTLVKFESARRTVLPNLEREFEQALANQQMNTLKAKYGY